MGNIIYDEILKILNECQVLFVTKSYSLDHVQIEARGQKYYFDLSKPHQVCTSSTNLWGLSSILFVVVSWWGHLVFEVQIKNIVKQHQCDWDGETDTRLAKFLRSSPMTSCFFDNNDEWHSPLKEMMRLCLSHSTGWGTGRSLKLVGTISEIQRIYWNL